MQDVYACLIYASEAQDCWWRPSLGSHGRWIWVGYILMGQCNFKLKLFGEQVYREPPFPINTTCIRQTEQITLPGPPPTPPALKNKLVLHPNRTVVSACSPAAMALLLPWMFRRKLGPDYMFGGICFTWEPHFIISSKPPTPTSIYSRGPFQRMRPIHLLSADRWTAATDFQPVFLRWENSQNRGSIESTELLL